MPDEPDDLGEGVTRAEDAFGGQLGRPDNEEGLDPNLNDADVITVAATQQAEAMFDLAVTVHDYVKNFAQLSYECQCHR